MMLRRERAVTVLVKGDKPIGAGDAEQDGGDRDEHADAQKAGDDRKISQ
jgi:hypothetical protein